MLITTTPGIEGKKIVEYKGIIFGEVVAGLNVFKDFMAGMSNFFGGRAKSYEKGLIKSREKALLELENRAQEIGANAVVGVRFDCEVLGDGRNNMLMVTATGTAVRTE